MFLVVLLLSACYKTQSTSKQQGSSANVQGNQQLQGYLSDLIISKNNYAVGEPILVKGNFHVQVDGNYYIEFGLDESSYQSLTILKSSQSACDQSKHYAGVWANNARNGDIVPFELSLQDYGKTGKYNVVGGVYSRCNVGSDIASATPYSIIIGASEPPISGNSGSKSNILPVVEPPVSCTPSGYFTELWVRQYGYYDSADNLKPRVIGRFKSTAPCPTTYYIEAGMLQGSFKPLSAVPLTQLTKRSGTPSACDGNTHFSGFKVNLEQGSIVNFQLFPQHYNNEGRYTLQGGVFYNNGQFCGNADVATFPAQEILFVGFAGSVIDNSWVKVI